MPFLYVPGNHDLGNDVTTGGANMRVAPEFTEMPLPEFGKTGLEIPGHRSASVAE